MRIGSISGIVSACLILSALSHAADALRDEDFQGAIQNRHESAGPSSSNMAQPSSSTPNDEKQHPIDHHTGSSTSTVVSNTSVSSISAISNGTNGNLSTHVVSNNGNNIMHVDTDRKPSTPSSPGSGLKPSSPSPSTHGNGGDTPSTAKPSADLNGGMKPSAPSSFPDYVEPGSHSGKASNPDSSSLKKSQHSVEAPHGHDGSRSFSSGSGLKPSSVKQESPSSSSLSPSGGIQSAKPSSSRQSPDDHSESLPLSSITNSGAKPANTMPAADQFPGEQTTSDSASPNVAKPAGNPLTNATMTNVPAPAISRPTLPVFDKTSGTPSIKKPGKRITTTTVTRKKNLLGKVGSGRASFKPSYLAPTPSRGKTPMYSPPRTPSTKRIPPNGHPPLRKTSTPALYSRPSSPKSSTLYQNKPRSPSPALYSVSRRAPSPVYSNPAPQKSTKKSTDYKAPTPKKNQSYKAPKKSSNSSSAEAKCLSASAIALLLTVGLLF